MVGHSVDGERDAADFADDTAKVGVEISLYFLGN